ncbi:uncharacterized protein LOC125863978 [Solanum stenotomum]|uniref:uncharacterized protein LOC125863978 n=1 Tax=Solanum stenotomum TaxID=172797 RepID=UPI0020D1F43C|nr:uncharacterized protein LOC125863978 [Solanum stenotomum]
MANHFFLNGEILYRRTSDLGLLRYVDVAEATRILEEIHAGTCGPHMNGFTLAKKILRAGYFWMTMERDIIRYVQKCHQCQVHGYFIWVPPNELNVMGSPWPFAAWGMDVIGPIEPPASNAHRFILVAIDYFTKWVEDSTYKAVTKKVVADFVRNNLVVIPAEVEIPSLRIIQEVGLDYAEWIRSKHEQLMLIDEKRMDAVCHGQLYQNRMTKAFNKKVKPRQFTLGQLVLKKIFSHQEEVKGKFAPNWPLHGS